MFENIDTETLALVTGGAASSSALLMMVMMMKFKGRELSGDDRKKMFDLMKGLIEKKAPAKPDAKPDAK